MPIPWDTDILIFAWTTAKVIFGSQARMRQNRRAIAVHDDLREISEDTLTKAQKEYIRPYDQELAELNYFPDLTYCVTNHRNYGSNLIRRYSNPTDSATCALTIVELKVKVGETESFKTSSHVGFRTRFADGKQLTTRNMSLKSVLDRPPYSTIQECRHTTKIEELKRRHDEKVARIGQPLPAILGKEAIFAAHREDHQRFCEYQLQRGTFRLLPDGAAYEVTEKARARGIWNHYNPFARRISLRDVLLTGLIGSVLPLFAILKLAPLAMARIEGTPLAVFPIAWITIGICYLLAGSLIGMISDRVSFQWIMLISYVPAHLIAGWSFGAAPYSTMAFLASFYVIRMRRRRALIFES